ncbi:MAG TPA: TonB-dependent receptor plug domain-containing protein [Steroidobacteraceae bacterium]|jgi:outer membrane receptor protein involved in Fe transport
MTSSRTHRSPPLAAGALALTAAIAAGSVNADQSLDEVVVTASLRDSSLSQLPQSVTVLDEHTLQAAGVQHFEDVLSIIPNLSWASGSSRPRFLQLRGIGEVEQYQGAPNPSVGFLIDDIDFSGVGMPATLFDVRQIEVLRGPQGTVYGANALAGLISVRTEDPGPQFDLRGEATVGDYQTRSAGIALGDSLADQSVGWRVVAQQYRGDGYRDDVFLHRDDTNGYDEGTLRAKLYWQPAPTLRADLALMDVDLNNGYDAWTIDNGFNTRSNQPGRDAQQSLGSSLRLSWTGGGFGELRSVTSAADSRIVYSFDSDWGNDAFWASCCGYSPFDYFDQDRRRRRTLAEDLRLIGDPQHRLFDRISWLVGVYFLRLTEGDDLLDTWNDEFVGAGSSLLHSDYRATNGALYTSLDSALGQRSSLTLGLRAEQRLAHYQDSADLIRPFPDGRDRMYGGNLSWSLHSAPRQTEYVTLARGFKGGGFNIGAQIAPDERRFTPEYVWSLESGIKRASLDGALGWQADVFYMRRESMQVYSSCQLQQDNPSTFVFFTRNASHGDNYGLEAQAQWQLRPRWQLSGSVGLLHTRYLGYDSQAIECPGGSPLVLDGRAQSFAPEYQLSAAVTYSHPSGFFSRLDASASDGFYFAAGQNQVAQAYQLFNLRVGYQRGAWQASVWTRNLFDRRYAVQGFYFGLVPPDFPNQRFIQNGDPRTVGLTVRYQLIHNED